MKLIKFLLNMYFYRKKIFFILLSINLAFVVVNKIYVLYYQKRLKMYNKNYEQLQKKKRKLYTIANYKTVIKKEKS